MEWEVRVVNRISAIIAMLTVLCSSVVYAEHAFVAIGPRIGTQGIGVEARGPIADGFFGRINGNYFNYSKKFRNGEIDLKGKLTLLSVPVMVDWHPFEESGFRLSVGVAYNGNKVKATGTAPQGATLGGVFYTKDQIGSVTAELSLGNRIAGIASVGYDSSFIANGSVSFNCEAGVIYAGKPKLNVTSTGLANNDPLLKERIKADATKGLKDIDKYLKFFPVISIGVKFAL
jgi:hypothetical protein